MNPLKIYREEIAKQANNGDGWITIKDPSNLKEWQAPKAPFLRWALNETFGQRINIQPSWNNICPASVMTAHEDHDYFDCKVGAGIWTNEVNFNLTSAWEAAVNKKKYELQKELLIFQITILSKTNKFETITGKAKIIKPGEETGKGNIAIIPHAGPEYENAIFEAAKNHSAVITAKGGRVAHLAIVSRELGASLIMWPQSIYLQDGDKLVIQPSERTISIA